MSAPSGYKAPERCSETCAGKPVFTEERPSGKDRRQAEYKCPKCGLLHVVADKPAKRGNNDA